MFGFLARSFSVILGSICLSVVPIIFFTLTSRRRNRGLLQKLLLGSYWLYQGLFSWLQPIILKEIGVDILNSLPRILITIGFSLGIGWGILSLLNLRLSPWLAAIFVMHGLFVGWQWELIERPNEFQMGVKIE